MKRWEQCGQGEKAWTGNRPFHASPDISMTILDTSTPPTTLFLIRELPISYILYPFLNLLAMFHVVSFTSILKFFETRLAIGDGRLVWYCYKRLRRGDFKRLVLD